MTNLGGALLVLVLLTSCNDVKRALEDGHITPAELEGISVEDFLDLLCSQTEGRVTVDGPVYGWPAAENADFLLSKLDDTRPCMAVKHYRSSFISGDRSTLGNEAAFLLLGIKRGEYPPGLNSDRDPMESKEEIQAWAKSLQREP